MATKPAAAAATTDVKVQTELTAYVLVMRPGLSDDNASQYFRLSQVAKVGQKDCRWIVLRKRDGASGASFTLDNLRKRTLELTLTPPIETFRGENVCHVTEIGFGLT